MVMDGENYRPLVIPVGFQKGNTLGGRTRGTRNQLNRLKDVLFDGLLAAGPDGRMQLETDIAALKPAERTRLAASLVPKVFDVAMSIVENPVPIVLETLDVVSTEVIEHKKTATIPNRDNGRKVLDLD
jgi:hypothetical protein